jgi:hypothetical protein
VVALPISDGLQHPHQGLHEVLQVLPLLKSCSKSDFGEKFALLIFRTYIFTSFHQVLSNCFCGLGVKAFECQLFVQITLQNKKF